MSIRLFHVVGDRFSELAATYDVVVCVSDVIAAMRSGSFPYGAGARFVAGQGLSPERVDDLFRAAEETGYLESMRRWKRASRADRKLIHRGQSKNVSITTPVQVGEDEFVSDLILDENDCIVGDKLNAQHLLGMVLVEAGRQMHVAVSEAFYIHKLPPEVPRDFSFAIVVFNHDFLMYAYPVALQLKLSTIAVDMSNRSRMQFHHLIDAVQGGQLVSQQELRSIVYPRKDISVIELARGKYLLDALQQEQEGVVED